MEVKPILMVSRYPPTISGAAVQMMTMADVLRKKGCEIEAACLFSSIHNVKLPRLFARLNISQFIELIALIRVLKTWSRNRYKIIHFHFFGNQVLLAALFLKLLKVQVMSKITMLGNDDPAYLLTRRRSKAISFLIPRYINNLTLVCPSKEILKVSAGFMEKSRRKLRIVYIPNGVDTTKFCPCRDSKRAKAFLNIPCDTHVLIMIGGVLYRKGADIAIKSLEIVVKKHRNTMLVFVGKDSYEKSEVYDYDGFNRFVYQLRECARRRSLCQKVRFVGRITDLVPYLNAADIFLLPSRKEGMPNALLEAMASGLPTVTSDLSGGGYDIVAEGDSGFITSLDPLEISEKICYLIENREIRKRMGRRAREIVLQKFNIDHISSQYIDLYRALVEGNQFRLDP